MTNPQEVYATFSGDIDSLAVSRFFNIFASFKNNGVKKVNLLIQSCGGNIHDGFALYTYLKNMPMDISTYNCGFIASIAMLIFLSANNRYASKLSKFMIHKSTLCIVNPTNIPEIKNKSNAIERDDSNIESILKTKINMPEDQWVIYKKMDLFISPDEALKYGIIHGISEFEPIESLPLVSI